MVANVILYLAGFISAFILFLFLSYLEVRKKRRKRLRKPSKKVRIDTYVKFATTLVLLHGLIMITLSYVLAWFGRDTVVEVSTTLITEVVAPLCLYMCTNCIMNIFEKNELTFSKPIQMQKMKEVNEKVFGNNENSIDDCPDDTAIG